jgi:hemoglobin
MAEQHNHAERDILSYSDISKVVHRQYAQLLADDFTAPKFTHLDLDVHLPLISNFWSFVLNVDAAEHPYRGSAFEPHVKLDLTHRHFEVWMEYLYQAIDENFSGPLANTWKEKARQMGMLFEYKLGLIQA